MRRLTGLIAVLGLLATPAMAARQCASAADQSTYEILTLREVMVVLATKCNRADDYNTLFVKRFQGAVQANERAKQSFFNRLYGRAGQGRGDFFTTELVNIISDGASRSRGEFCGRAGLIFNELVALRSQEDLAAYAAVKDLPPASVSMCPGGAAAPARRR